MAMVNGKFICDLCGCETDEVFTIDGEQVCPHCMDNPWRVNTCQDCGTVHLAVNMTETEDGNYVCSDCVDDYEICDDCGRAFHTDAIGYYSEFDRMICNNCLDEYYCYCERCHSWVDRDRWDYDHDCCEDCVPEDTVKGYHHHKDLFRSAVWGKDCRRIGVELEVEGDHAEYYPDEMAEILGNKYNKDQWKPHIVFEHDGSLSENGFEIISTPHDVDEFYKFDWDGMFADLRNEGYVSHDNDNCGLHLHFSREWFGRTERSRELGIRRVISLYELYYDEFVKASRRTRDQVSDWAKPYGWECCEYENTKRAYDDPHWYGRYRAVNLCNYNTVEFRMGRGTLKTESFMAWADLHITICRNCHKVRNKELNNLDAWFAGIKPETVKYLKSKDAFTDFVRAYENKEGVLLQCV